MITTLVLLLLSAPPDTTGATRTYTDKAHQENVRTVRDHIVPNLMGYESISANVLQHLSFMTQVQSTMNFLDRFRKSGVAKALERSIHGAGWITMAWDELHELVQRTNKAQTHLNALKTRSQLLLTAAQNYKSLPNNQTFGAFVSAFSKANVVFNHADRAFGDLRKFMDVVTGTLKYAISATSKLKELPFVGTHLDGIRSKLTAIRAQVQAAQGVILIARNAITRDKKYLSTLKRTMNNGRAHDAYDAANKLLAQKRWATALKALEQVQTQWPHTEWAHRADRKSVDLVAKIDAVHTELEQLRISLSDAHARLKTRLPPQQQVAIEVAMVSQAKWLQGLCICLVVMLMIGAIAWRKHYTQYSKRESNDLEKPDYL